MKKITFLIFLIATTIVVGQTTLYDFEDSGELPQFQFGNLVYANIVNPDMSGVNTTMRVLEINKPDNADWFGGIGFETPGLPLINLANGTEFTMQVWAPIANQSIRFQIQNGLNGEPTYNRDVVIANAGVWTDVTFDFSDQPGLTGMEQYPILVIQPNYDPSCEGGSCTTVGTGNGGVWYIDNIVQIGVIPTCDDGIQNGMETGVDCGGPDCDPCVPTCDDGIQNGNETGVDCGGPDCAPCIPTEPTVAAPVPTPLQSQVINMYSNTYTTDVNVSSWRSAWSTSTYTDNVQVDGPGSECKRYIDADFVGVEFYGADAVDATSMNFFHVDVWSPNATVFRVKLVDLDAGTVEGELAYNIAQGQWVSLDIDLDDFANPSLVTNSANLLTSRNSIQQLIFSGQPVGTFDFFIDNVYFSEVESLSTPELNISEIGIYPNPTLDVWNVKTNNQEINSIEVFDIHGRQAMSLNPNASEAIIDGSSLPAGLYFATINTINGSKSIKLIKQ
ncbi:hypothetical protein C1T31_00595 [Hanstruepera neustonica]|uniref:Secretion system C-terminal sorting domain-containing protein n=1 Tax=Hanstruepera neustonica TaxID=1445657 RepID=A0A2K1E301_9FLAO|nr:T9SS type A sorting domain-containing protein [Hanstruepera neustonica]PNQ74676.1 hypothetical protein C1T31_00595 [Hanstruepera neustonica]